MKDRTDPTNRDTVPAMLTPGEFVVNKEATQMYADQLKAMNNNGLALRAKRNSMVGVPPAEGGVPQFNEGGEAKGNWWTNLVGSSDYWDKKNQEAKERWAESRRTGEPIYSPREIMSFLPVVGDAIAAEEVYNELRKPNPNWLLVGALGGATIVGAIPGVGDAAAALIRKGAKAGLEGIGQAGNLAKAKIASKIEDKKVLKATSPGGPLDPLRNVSSKPDLDYGYSVAKAEVNDPDAGLYYYDPTPIKSIKDDMADYYAMYGAKAGPDPWSIDDYKASPSVRDAAAALIKKGAKLGLDGIKAVPRIRPRPYDPSRIGMFDINVGVKPSRDPMKWDAKTKAAYLQNYRLQSQKEMIDHYGPDGMVMQFHSTPYKGKLDVDNFRYRGTNSNKTLQSKLNKAAVRDQKGIFTHGYDQDGSRFGDVIYAVESDSSKMGGLSGFTQPMDTDSGYMETFIPRQAVDDIRQVWPISQDKADKFLKTYKYNTGGLVSFLKDKEGFEGEAYPDLGWIKDKDGNRIRPKKGSKWTIGYGRIFNDDGSPVKQGDTTDRKSEDAWLDSRAKKEYDAVKKFSDDEGYGWNQDQLEAFASFRFNAGPENFKMLAHKNKDQPGFMDVPEDPGYDIRYNRSTREMIDKMPLYRNVKVGDDLVRVPGLEARRAAEVDLAGPVSYDKRYQGWNQNIPPKPQGFKEYFVDSFKDRVAQEKDDFKTYYIDSFKDRVAKEKDEFERYYIDSFKEDFVPGLKDRIEVEKEGWKNYFYPTHIAPKLEMLGKGMMLQGAAIPGYNNGGMPMEDDDIMNFIMNYQGKLGDVNPEDVAAGVISDEDLLQNSSDAGANSFMQANEMQYGDPRQSMPMPGAFMGNITDAQSLRGGVVRPDMMPPGYVPPAPEVMPRSTSPQGGIDRIAMANLKQAELDTPFPTTQMLDTQMFKDSLRPEAINAPAIPKKEPFFDTSYAYNRDGEEIILDQEGGNKENITIPVTKSKFAEQADAIKVNQAELEKAEAERLLRLATTEKSRLDAIKRIEAAQKKLDEAKGVVQDNVTARENLNTIEDRNTLRNAELELASLRKEKANATNQLHIDQLDKLISEKESLLKDVKTELGIDETNDNEVQKKTEVLTSRVPIPRNLEEAAQSGEVEKAGSKVKQDSPQWESAKNFLKDIFGDIFNKKDLVRAITIYLGARIFGASGNQAGAMAGKYYLGKQDAHEATVAAYAKSGKYTPDSVALYKKTRNLADLVAIGKPVTPTGEFKMYYGVTKDGNTVRVNAQKFRIGEGSYVWKRKTKDGYVSFDVENYTADGSSNPNFDRDAYEQRFDRLYDQAKDLAKGNLTYIDEDDKEQKYFENLSEADIAQDLAKWAIDNDVNIGTAGDALKMAINMAKQAERKTGNTSDLTPFLNQAYIVAETNPSGESAVAFKNLKGEYIPYGDLKDAITNVATKASETNPSIGDMNPVLRQTAIIKIASRLYKDYATARATDGATDIYVDAAKNNDTTPLYEFMRAYR